MGGTTMAAFPTEVAQELLLPEPDVLTGVMLAADDGVGQDELVERIRPLLPEGAEAITGEALTTEQEKDVGSDFLDFFETFLLVFAGIFDWYRPLADLSPQELSAGFDELFAVNVKSALVAVHVCQPSACARGGTRHVP
jgi:hypothetical protein